MDQIKTLLNSVEKRKEKKKKDKEKKKIFKGYF